MFPPLPADWLVLFEEGSEVTGVVDYIEIFLISLSLLLINNTGDVLEVFF